MKYEPFTLGITGGIGSGKSLVAYLLELLYNIPVYDCDTAAKGLYDTDSELREQVCIHFGKSLYETPDGTLDRQKLAGIIFNNPQALKEIEALVHPRVVRHFDAWRSLYAECKLVAVESAILLHSPIVPLCDALLIVDADRNERIERTRKRDRVTANEVASRIARQESNAEALPNGIPVYSLFNGLNTPLLPRLEELIPALLTHAQAAH